MSLPQPLCRSGAEAPSAGAYGRVLEAYLGGSAHDATAAVMPCTVEGLGPAVRAAVKNSALLPAVVFLLTRVAVELQSRGRFAGAATHLALAGHVVAEGLKGRAARDAVASDSLRRWLVEAANYCAAGFNPEGAKRFLDLCLGYFPDEAAGWLAAGTLYESTAFPDGFSGVALPVPPWIARREAESHYRAALRLDPDLVEARLRLGRVLEKRGDFTEAERHLEWVTTHGDDPFLVAFAWLFRGEIAERQEDLPRAARNYGFAVEVEPQMRAGLLGLSHALHRQGLRALSGELLEAVLVASRGRHDNLWLDYHRGPARRLHRAVQALRDEERGLQSPSAVARVD
jgi:tetratricopeptide (TPR) repeat protein